MRQIAQLTAPELITAPDGTPAIALSVRFTAGPDELLAIPVAELGNLAGYFFNLNQWLHENGHTDLLAEAPLIGPVTVHGAGLTQGSPSNDSDILLVLDLAAVRLAFQMPGKNWAETLSAARPILLAASVPKSDRPI